MSCISSARSASSVWFAIQLIALLMRHVVCPGGMLTPQVTDFTAPDHADYKLIMRIAAPRGLMEPRDVASVIAFLAGDEAAAVHGAVYVVDHGKLAG